MADELTCPECGEVVPRRGLTTEVGKGPGPSGEPPKENSICPACRAHLERFADAESGWRLREEHS